MNVNRRVFLRATAIVLGSEALFGRRLARALARGKGLTALPDHGTLAVANDFHSRYVDFRDWLEVADIEKRLSLQEDFYVLINGDVIDIKFPDGEQDPVAEEEGDIRIIDEIRRLQSQFGEDRVIYTIGNHEHTAVQLYNQLPLNPFDRKKYLNHPSNRDTYREWTFINMMRGSDERYFRTLPIGVRTASGVLFVHAGPSPDVTSLDEISEMRCEDVDEDLIRGRPYETEDSKSYGPDNIADFLQRTRSSLLVVGHSPLHRLNPIDVRDGVGLIGEQGVVLAPSYGCLPNQPKKFLELDLGRRYESNAHLEVGLRTLDQRVD